MRVVAKEVSQQSPFHWYYYISFSCFFSELLVTCLLSTEQNYSELNVILHLESKFLHCFIAMHPATLGIVAESEYNYV